jgi:LAGLIDADG endonuclease
MTLLIKFFKCGKLYPLTVNGSLNSTQKYFNERKNKGLNSVISFVINTNTLNKNIVIPFFNKYPLFNLQLKH